ncbi:hypothetical protein F2P79_010687 [Pimephales promelas]|nr:hypothetical protein F2P79_010687 [Pimephales promelas]KAG1951747.1 hypothetical protein F2P79_010687 [Pimephales promelas]
MLPAMKRRSACLSDLPTGVSRGFGWDKYGRQLRSSQFSKTPPKFAHKCNTFPWSCWVQCPTQSYPCWAQCPTSNWPRDSKTGKESGKRERWLTQCPHRNDKVFSCPFWSQGKAPARSRAFQPFHTSQRDRSFISYPKLLSALPKALKKFSICKLVWDAGPR